MQANFKIPDEFDRVIKKLYPEIENIQIKNVETFEVMSSNPLELPDERYKVSIIIFFNRIGPSSFKDVYSQMINQLFVYTYGDNDFVRFVVDDFVVYRPQTKQQKFMDMFYVGG